MLQPERNIKYRHSRLSQAAELEIENVFRSPGGASRETWSFGARWREGIGILDLPACAKGVDRHG